MGQPKYKAKFEGSLHVLPKDHWSEWGISKASKSPLIPEKFRGENIDLLPVVFNIAVVNQFNLNGDGIDTSVAMKIFKSFIDRPMNIEHQKKHIVGHIVNASLTEEEPDFYENDAENFANKTSPFFISAAGVIYRHIYSELAEEILACSDPNDEMYQSISASWEIGFSKYAIAYGSKNLEDSTIIMPDDPEFLKLRPELKAFGGSGYDEEGKAVNRIIVGDAFPLGIGFTLAPAAAVKGVYTESSDCEDDMDDDESESNINKVDTKISLINNNLVKLNKIKTLFNMDEKQFQQLLATLEEALAQNLDVKKVDKESIASDLMNSMRDALVKHGEAWKSNVEKEREAREKSESELAEAQTKLSEVEKELKSLKDSVAAQEAAQLFNDRMDLILAKYELSDQEQEIVAKEVKDIVSAEDFEAYQAKVAIIFASKDKEFLAKQEEEKQKAIEQAVAQRLSKSTPKDEENEDVEEEIEADASDTDLTNNNQEQSDQKSLVQKLIESKNFKVTIS